MGGRTAPGQFFLLCTCLVALATHTIATETPGQCSMEAECDPEHGEGQHDNAPGHYPDEACNLRDTKGVEGLLDAEKEPEEHIQLPMQRVDTHELLQQASQALKGLQQAVQQQGEELQHLSGTIREGGQPQQAVHDPTTSSPAPHANAAELPMGLFEGFGIKDVLPAQRTKGSVQHTVLKAKKVWGDYLEFMAAVNVESVVTCVHVLNQRLPPRNVAPEGMLPKHVALGDDSGHLFIFSNQGDLAKDYDTGTTSAVQFMSSLYWRKNTTALVTGHSNGEVRVHMVIMENRMKRKRSVEEEMAIRSRQGVSDVYLHLVSLPLGEAPHPLGAQGQAPLHPSEVLGEPPNMTAEVGVNGMVAANAGSQGIMRVHDSEVAPEPPRLVHVLIVRQKGGRKMVAVWYSTGAMRVFHMTDGTVLYEVQTNHTPLTVQASGNLILALSDTHMTIMRTNLLSPPVELKCEGLNGSSMVSAGFDTGRLFRAHAISDRGEILTLNVPTDRHQKVCKVHRAQPFPLPPGANITLLALRGGYVMLGHPAGFALLNVSSVMKDGVDILASESVSALSASMGHHASRVVKPMVDTTHEKMGGFIALSLGGGLVAFFDGGLHLPLPRGMLPVINSTAWMQPIFIGLMILVAMFQFNKTRNRVKHEPTPGFRRGGRGAMGAGSSPDPEVMFQEAIRNLHERESDSIPTRSARRMNKMGGQSDGLGSSAISRPFSIREEREE